MNDQPDKPTVFISYSRDDAEWKARLRLHLEALEQQNHIKLWDDRSIAPGSTWYPQLKQAMDRAAMAVCLLSKHYLASPFVNREEIPYLLKRRESDGMLLLPILVRPCLWKAVPGLREIQMLPWGTKPISLVYRKERQEQELLAIAEFVHHWLQRSSCSFDEITRVCAASVSLMT